MARPRPIIRAELIDVAHELAHAVAMLSFRPGTSFALMQSASSLATVTPHSFDSATERLAVASAGPLFDLRITKVIKTNAPDDALEALVAYLDVADTGSDDCDSAQFRRAMDELRDDEDRDGEILDALTVAVLASRTAAQLYSGRRKALGMIALALRSLGPTECLVFASDAVTQMLLNFAPELTVCDLAEWLVEQQVPTELVTRRGAITSPLAKESKT